MACGQSNVKERIGMAGLIVECLVALSIALTKTI